MSLVSGTEESSFTDDLGSVTYCGDESAPCVTDDELCPMSELLFDKQRKIAELQAKLEDAEQRVRHLDSLAKLGELSAVVAHEIRNPLAGISATAEVMLDDISADDPHYESVAIIFEEIQRLEKTVRNLLDFARDRKPFITRVDLREVIEKVLAEIDGLAAEQNVTVTGACPNDLDNVQADPELIAQAFTNLALNAVQAMAQGGELGVKLYGETDEHGRWVRVAVSDSGCGIDSEHVDRIFDPFFTTKTNGAGLGLAVSKKIIEAQKGIITVDSKPGGGTTFVVSLPAAWNDNRKFASAQTQQRR